MCSYTSQFKLLYTQAAIGKFDNCGKFLHEQGRSA